MCLRKPLEGFGKWTEMFIFKVLDASLSLLHRQLATGRVSRDTGLLQYSKWNIRTGGLDKSIVMEVTGRAK